MPIKARIDMLSTGVRTPIGIKIFGADLEEIERIGERLEGIVRDVPGTRSVFAERVAGGYFVDFEPRRDQLARYGLTVAQVQDVIMTAIGGENVTTTIEGRERYPVNVRYPRELRDDLDQLRRVLVATPGGAQIPLAQLADIQLVQGPAMLRDENGFLAGYVYVDITGRDIGGYVEEAKRIVRDKLALPPGYVLQWSGQYENMLRVRERLKLVVPITLVLIFVLLYVNTRSAFKAVRGDAGGAVLRRRRDLALPLPALQRLDRRLGGHDRAARPRRRDRRLHAAVPRPVLRRRKRRGLRKTLADLDEAIVHGAVKRVRPKMMTVTAAFMGLLPIMWSTSAGADVMKRIAAPMIGGLVTSFLLELLVYPAIYKLWKRRELGASGEETVAAGAS